MLNYWLSVRLIFFLKLPIFISCYGCSFIMTTCKEHDNLFMRVCLPSASNYRRMRGARAGFVLKVNILYIEAYPLLERFLLSTKWTSSYVSLDEVCTHSMGSHAIINAHVRQDVMDTHTHPHLPTHPATHSNPDKQGCDCLTIIFCLFST